MEGEQMTYIPGSAYNAGFKARMEGQSRSLLTADVTNVYIQEWQTGWDDAHKKIISEARENSGCNKPKCCKNFIQD
jgi:ribosome modulation factor